MQVTYQLTDEDFYQGFLTWRRRRAWQRWLRGFAYVVVGAGSLLSLTVLLLDPAHISIGVALGGVGFGVVWFTFMLYGPRYFARRQFRSMPSAQSPYTLDISESGLEFHSAVTDSKVSWPAYVAWAEGKSVFIIQPQPRMYIPIPKRAFTEEQLTEFRELLRRNIAPK